VSWSIAASTRTRCHGQLSLVRFILGGDRDGFVTAGQATVTARHRSRVASGRVPLWPAHAFPQRAGTYQPVAQSRDLGVLGQPGIETRL